jgi:hypothetical protein
MQEYKIIIEFADGKKKTLTVINSVVANGLLDVTDKDRVGTIYNFALIKAIYFDKKFTAILEQAKNKKE